MFFLDLYGFRLVIKLRLFCCFVFKKPQWEFSQRWPHLSDKQLPVRLSEKNVRNLFKSIKLLVDHFLLFHSCFKKIKSLKIIKKKSVSGCVFLPFSCFLGSLPQNVLLCLAAAAILCQTGSWLIELGCVRLVVAVFLRFFMLSCIYLFIFKKSWNQENLKKNKTKKNPHKV